MTSQVFLSGKLLTTKMSETAKGKPMLRALIECEQMRPSGRGEYKLEIHTFPVLAFSWVADQLRDLRPGSQLTVVAHLSGTKFEQPGQETRHGCQIVADAISVPIPSRPAPFKQLNS
jgi:Single-strand binding protein family